MPREPRPNNLHHSRHKPTGSIGHAFLLAFVLPAAVALSLATTAASGASPGKNDGKPADGKPADKAATPPIAVEVKTKKADDRVEIKVQGDAATCDVFSPSGIGSATLTSPDGRWPTTVTLRLHLRGLESLTVSNAKTKLTASVESHGAYAKHLDLSDEGKDAPPPRPAGTEIRVLDSAGKPIPGLPDASGSFEITLPKVLLEGQPKTLELRWIDFYRG
jgi:hypothetical protein